MTKKLVRLTFDDYSNITPDDVGMPLYYFFASIIWEYRIKSVSLKRVTLTTNSDDMHPRRYLNEKNFMRWYRVEK